MNFQLYENPRAAVLSGMKIAVLGVVVRGGDDYGNSYGAHVTYIVVDSDGTRPRVLDKWQADSLPLYVGPGSIS